jgi:hypothetical protein
MHPPGAISRDALWVSAHNLRDWTAGSRSKSYGSARRSGRLAQQTFGQRAEFSRDRFYRHLRRIDNGEVKRISLPPGR